MNKKLKQKEKQKQSTRELIGINEITDYSLKTPYGELVYFIIHPTNISALSESSISARIEKSLKDQGFTTRKANNADIKRLLGVYYEQNVTTEKYEDYDGERWVVLGDT